MQVVLVHGLGLSKSIWSLVQKYLVDVEMITNDLPGHGCSYREGYSWGAIWRELYTSIPEEKWPTTKLVLHSFSAGLVPEVFESKVLPQQILLVEGIVYPDDATWTKIISELSDEAYPEWLERWRKVSEITLRSQLVRKFKKEDILNWSQAFELVRGDALRFMAKELQARVRSNDLATCLKNNDNIHYLRGENSRLTDKGKEFLVINNVAIEEVSGSGHFPMLDNPKDFAKKIKTL